MSRIAMATALLVSIGAGAWDVRASDRVAVYAKVDRVLLQPNADAPETIQIFGVFSVAERNNANDYRPAARGYLYYRLPAKRDVARREWTDLKAIAATGQIVAFGSRWEGTPRVREAKEPPANPDEYTINTGLTKVEGRTDYAPVRALAEARR
jgi:hypothetical protein